MRLIYCSLSMLALHLVACSGDDDGTHAGADAGMPGVDSGMPGVDSGSPDPDAGGGDPDSGSTDADAGPLADAGDTAVDLRIRLHRLDPHTGYDVVLRVEDRSIVPLPPPVFLTESIEKGGDVEFVVPDGMPRDVFGVFIHFYVDRDPADGTCTDPEPAWQAFVSNTFMEPEIAVDIDVDDDVMATPEDCMAALTPG